VAGTLYVVATPLGNLADLSPRAADTLKRAAVVAAEDTRHTKTLVAHVGSHAELVSFPRPLLRRRAAAHPHHAGRRQRRRPRHRRRHAEHLRPGTLLVAAARARGFAVVTVPGPTAVAAALAVSGLGADRYLFLGFLPRKGTDRKRLLGTVAESEWTVVLFESPNRVADLLQDLADACGAERRAAVAREMTKIFEETKDGTLAELAGYFAEAPARGEVTVVVAGTGKPRPRPEPAPDPEALARTLLAEGMTRKDVVERLTEETGIPRNTAYRLVNEL